MEQKERKPKDVYAVMCVVINKEDEILLLKRASYKELFPNQWAIVGTARLSDIEDKAKAAQDEIKDELGLEGEILKNAKATSFLISQDTVHVSGFLIRVDSSIVTLNHEHTEFKWVSKDKLKENELNPLLEKYIIDLIIE